MSPVRVTPAMQTQLIAHVMTELAARAEREKLGAAQYQSDICDWAERHFFIPNTSEPIKLPLHQKAILRYFFSRREDTHHFPFQTVIYSSIKKSGKSTIAGVVARHFSETQSRYSEIMCVGNDQEQAKERSFKEVRRSIELTPGYNYNKEALPGRWNVHKLSMRCLLTGSVIKAIAVDAKGEAGGQHALTIWTELWGAEDQDAKRFWDEMVPIPTVPDSIRLVETYAGYDGESELLQGLYNLGMDGHQLTAGELATAVCRPDKVGESYQDFVNCWHETRGDPEVLIPIWVNKAASLGMYWDSGLQARRMPWQHMFLPKIEEEELTPDSICAMCFRSKHEHEIGITANEYYASEEAAARTPQAFARLHKNEWVGAESAFVPMESWDACGEVHEIRKLQDGEKTPVVLGVDAAVTGDCFGILAVNRCPHDNTMVDIRAVKVWVPSENGGIIQLAEPEAFMRAVPKVNNVVQICFDPFQLSGTAQNLEREGVAWMKPFNQMGDRLKADSELFDLIINRRVHFWHEEGCAGKQECSCYLKPLRQHIMNANAKMQVSESSKLRLVKKANGRPIDLAVCLSMSAFRCLYLRL